MGTPSICRPLPQNSQKWGFSGGKGCPFFDLQNAKRVKRGLKRAHFSLGATPAERRARLFQASQVWEIRAEDTQVMKKSPGGLRSTRRRENHWDQAKMCVRWAAAVDPRRRCGGPYPRAMRAVLGVRLVRRRGHPQGRRPSTLAMTDWLKNPINLLGIFALLTPTAQGTSNAQF